MAKGDRITITMRAGESIAGEVIQAMQNGRTVDSEIAKEMGISWLSVTEKTRGGTVVKEVRVALDSVISVVTEKRE